MKRPSAAQVPFMKWYLLNPNGMTVSAVILAGPFNNESEAHQAGSMANVSEAHVALLNSMKVERHLAEDRRYAQWLRERTQ